MLTTEHWRAWQGSQFPLGSWRQIDGGVEAIAGAPTIDLISRARYRNFIFRFEVSLPTAGNSGVLYRVNESASLAWHSGPEMQLLDDAGHPDGADPLTRNGALYALEPAALATPIKAGCFIAGQLIVRDEQVEHWLDGRQVLEYRLDDVGLRARIANSKFACFSNFANEGEGHLVLQHHGDAVCFRHLSLEPLV